jgi:hypothetical protein
MPPRKRPAGFEMTFNENQLPALSHARRVLATPLMSDSEQETFCGILESERGSNMTDEQICEEAGISYGHFVTTVNSFEGAPFLGRINAFRAGQRDNLAQLIVAKTAQFLKTSPELEMSDIAQAAMVYEKVERTISNRKKPDGPSSPPKTAGFIAGPNPRELNSDAPSPRIDGVGHAEGTPNRAGYTIEDGLFGEGPAEGDAG